MTLRLKILVATAVTMVLVLGLLAFNLGFTAWSRATLERHRVGTLVSKVVQDWIQADVSLQEGPANAETWEQLTRKFSSSLLFKDWVIVDSAGNILAYDANLTGVSLLAGHPDLKTTFRDRRMRIDGDRVFFPLQISTHVSMVVMTCDIGGLVVQESYIYESIKNVLGIMALGTIMVVLNIFILLNRFVIRPLDQLSEASYRIAHGDYSRTIPGDATSSDEISQLIQAFNTMMTGLGEYHHTLEQKIEEAREQIKQTQQGLVIAQRLSATGTLAAGVAHEINNPLGGLINATRTLRTRQDMDPAKRDQYLELIGEGLDRIQDIVKRLLQFTPRKTEPQPVQLTQVVQRAIALIQHRLDKRSILIENRLPTELPQIFGDERELQQVFVNLVINAADAIEDETGQITIDHEIHGAELAIVVEDTGCGMTEEEISKAFDIFFTTKPVGQGTGLGLSVVSNILSTHSGRIEMKSRKGVGTRVFVILPIHGGASAAAATTPTRGFPSLGSTAPTPARGVRLPPGLGATALRNVGAPLSPQGPGTKSEPVQPPVVSLTPTRLMPSPIAPVAAPGTKPPSAPDDRPPAQ